MASLGDRNRFTSEFTQIDIRDWAARGYLYDGSKFFLTFKYRETIVRHIYIRIDDELAFFNFIDKPEVNFSDKKSDYVINIAYTPCHFGGQRPWFICAETTKNGPCNRQAAILYRDGNRLACRHCLKLSYPTQHLARYERILKRQETIRRKLGATAPGKTAIPSRPKGMHRSTYCRLLDELREKEEEFEEEEARFLMRHLPR